uniref:Uncharacterized protein n=1 Tax=Panagrolaimus sp. ES5 TaxID=591445 RepID=A0AC34FBF4_9BILA
MWTAIRLRTFQSLRRGDSFGHWNLSGGGGRNLRRGGRYPTSSSSGGGGGIGRIGGGGNGACKNRIARMKRTASEKQRNLEK